MNQRVSHSTPKSSLTLSCSVNEEHLEENFPTCTLSRSFSRTNTAISSSLGDTEKVVNRGNSSAFKEIGSLYFSLERMGGYRRQRIASNAARTEKINSCSQLPVKRGSRNRLHTSLQRTDSHDFHHPASGGYVLQPSRAEVYGQELKPFFCHTAPIHLFSFSPPPCCNSFGSDLAPQSGGSTNRARRESGVGQGKEDDGHSKGMNSPNPPCRLSSSSEEGCRCQRPLKSFSVCGCQEEWKYIDMETVLAPSVCHPVGGVTEICRNDHFSRHDYHCQNRGEEDASIKFFGVPSSVSSSLPAQPACERDSPPVHLTPFASPSSLFTTTSSSFSYPQKSNATPSAASESAVREGKRTGSPNYSSCPACPPPPGGSHPKPEYPFFSAAALRLAVPPLRPNENVQMKSTTLPPSQPSLCLPGPRSLPSREEEVLPPLTRALHQVGQDKPGFRAKVFQQRAALLPYASSYSDEWRMPVTEYFCSAHATHVLHYLREDMLRDRPEDPISYIARWAKRYRALCTGR